MKIPQIYLLSLRINPDLSTNLYRTANGLAHRIPAPRLQHPGTCFAGVTGQFARLLSACMRPAALALLCAVSMAGITAPAQAQTEQTLVSNIGQGRDTFILRQQGAYQAFTTGNNALGYVLNSVELYFTRRSASASHISASLHRMDSGEPGDKLANLGNPDSIVVGSNVFSAPAATVLSAGTDYAVVLSISDNWYLGGTYSRREDSGSQSGWSIEDTYYNLLGSEYTAPAGRFSLMIRVNGVVTQPPSDDATLSGLTLTDSGGAVEIDPVFTADNLGYTTLVPRGVTSITLDATANHSGASLKFMNGKEMDIMDVDPDTEGFQVALMVGENIFKVQVEAENGNKRVYTVNVTRQGGPISLSLDPIASDGVVNIREKADGFTLVGDAEIDEMGGSSEIMVTVTIGTETLTTTTDAAGAWSVSVPPDAEYISEPGVSVTVNANGPHSSVAPEMNRELKVDLTPPVLKSAVVEGDELTLTFDETLGQTGLSLDNFSVSVNGEVLPRFFAVGRANNIVNVFLLNPVSASDTVIFSYDRLDGPDIRPVIDEAGNEIEFLADHPVENATRPGEKCAGSEESLRLADGGEAKEGRLEICADDDTSDNTSARWGTVCDDYWTDDDADVACRALGFERSEPYAGRFRSSRFGAGAGPVWLDDMLCRGNEASLLDCPLASGRTARDAIGVHNCKADEIVGVRCIAAGDVVRPYVNGRVDITGTGADGYYMSGDTIRVTLTFTETVTVDTAGGTPSLDLALVNNDSSVNRTASYTAGSDTKQLVFEYRTTTADGTFDELQVLRHSLTMNGGTIRNAGGVDVLLVNPFARVSPVNNPQGAMLSVADATAEEGAQLAFRVTLSRTSERRVSVSYRTEDGTATAGEDYSAVSGTLIFAPGETTKTITVATRDDSIDDDGETVMLRLTSYSGAYLEDSKATGTIHNSDPLPQGWLSRFGRTGAVHIVDMLNSRFDEAAGADNRFTLGGQTMDLRSSFPRTPESGETTARSTGGTVSRWIPDQARHGAQEGQTSEATPLEHALWNLLTNSNLQSDTRRFLSGSSFDLSLSGSSPADLERGQGPVETIIAVPESPGHWSLWGRGALTQLSGQDTGVNINGDVLTGLMGVDYARNRWLAGMALAYHDGNGSYTSTRNAGTGDLDSTLVTVNPYLRYALTERLSVWGTLGYGTGNLRLTQTGTELNSVPGEPAGAGVGLQSDPGVIPPQQAIETDMSMAMGALGLRGVVYASVSTELALKTDALWVRTSSDETDGMRDASADVSRIRLLLSGRHQRVMANDAILSPSFELGMRYDDGDAETGFGMELGGGLRYADALLGLTVETKARALLAHEDGGYEEWGVGGSLSLDPGRLGRGLALRLDSGWGLAESGAQALWQRQTTAGIAPQHDIAAQGRLTAELGYGMDVPWTYGILTPYSGMEWTGAHRTLRLGWRYTLGRQLSLSLDGERREDGHTPPEYALMLRTSLPW